MPNADAPRPGSEGLFLRVAVCIAVVLGVSLDFQERFFTDEVSATVARYQGFDRDLGSASGGEGFFLYFRQFPPQLAWIGLDIYSRCVFTFYPRRVLAADPGTPIFSAEQLQAASFDPDAGWLLRQGTPVEITYTFNPDDGAVGFTVQRVAGVAAPAR